MTNLESAAVSVVATLVVGVVLHVLATRGLRRQIGDVKEQNRTLAQAVAGAQTVLKELEARIPAAVAPFVLPGQQPMVRQAVQREVFHVVQGYQAWPSIVQLYGPFGMTMPPPENGPVTDVSAKQAL